MIRPLSRVLFFGAMLASTSTLVLIVCAAPAKPAVPAPPAAADAARNFGFRWILADEDGHRRHPAGLPGYAGGRWLDAAKIVRPAGDLRLPGVQETVQTQLRELLQEAARTSGAAPKGSPAQQVGDFYASGMDVARLTSLAFNRSRPSSTASRRYRTRRRSRKRWAACS